MASLLFNTPPTDPATYAAAVLTLTFAAVLACALPLRRALRLDPVVLFKA
jgi:ABC-type antimicrobial peptide transport system permease subunit